MTLDRSDQLHLLKWSLIIVGPAMTIPGSLMFGLIEYICGYLIFSAVLLACVFAAGNASRVLRRFGPRADLKSIDQSNYL
jgi:hypothetical protein